MNELRAAVEALLAFYPQTITNQFIDESSDEDKEAQDVTSAAAAAAAAGRSVSSVAAGSIDNHPPHSFPSSSSNDKDDHPQKTVRTLSSSMADSRSTTSRMADTSELLVTLLTYVLSMGLSEECDLWDILETLECIPAKVAAAGAVASDSSPNSLPAQHASRRCHFASQIVFVIKTTFGDFPKWVRTRALLRLALNQGCLSAALELLARWNAREIAAMCPDHPPVNMLLHYSSAERHGDGSTGDLWSDSEGPLFEQFAATIAPVGGVPLCALEAGEPKGFSVVHFDMKLCVPALGETASVVEWSPREGCTFHSQLAAFVHGYTRIAPSALQSFKESRRLLKVQQQQQQRQRTTIQEQPRAVVVYSLPVAPSIVTTGSSPAPSSCDGASSHGTAHRRQRRRRTTTTGESCDEKNRTSISITSSAASQQGSCAPGRKHRTRRGSSAVPLKQPLVSDAVTSSTTLPISGSLNTTEDALDGMLDNLDMFVEQYLQCVMVSTYERDTWKKRNECDLC